MTNFTTTTIITASIAISYAERDRFRGLVKCVNSRRWHCETTNRRDVIRVWRQACWSTRSKGSRRDVLRRLTLFYVFDDFGFQNISHVYTRCRSCILRMRMNIELEPLEKEREREFERAFLTSCGGAHILSWPVRGNSARPRVSKLNSSRKLAARNKTTRTLRTGPVFVRFAVVRRARGLLCRVPVDLIDEEGTSVHGSQVEK